MNRLTKTETRKIADLYNLGKVRKTKIIKSGMINHNIIFETDKGKFIVRFLRKNPSQEYLKERKIEFKALNFLEANNFPYKIPTPILNKNKKVISKISSNYMWVYHFIDGKLAKKLTTNEIKEAAKALAIYHKIIKKFKRKNKRKKVKKAEWLSVEYDKMEKMKPKNRLDEVMLRNIQLFKKALKKIKEIKFEGRVILTHSDFQVNNILFRGKKVSGILDFDNIDLNFKAKDIAICAKSICDTHDELDKKKLKIFLTEYRKHNSLSNKEEKQIAPLLIRNYCIIFWWAYKGKMKNDKKRLETTNYIIRRMKKLIGNKI